MPSYFGNSAGSLGAFESETTISTITLQATEPDGGTITFNITNGALPTGLSLTGANIDGTTTAESSTTLYSFTIEAIDDENQSSTPRNFSITVNAVELVPSENFTINTYTGNGSTQSIEGKIGTAASFNGSTSKIELPNGISGTGAFSVSVWINSSNITDAEGIWSIGVANGTDVYAECYIVNGIMQFRVRNSATAIFDATTPTTGYFTTNTWHNIVCVFPNTTAVNAGKLYIDGAEVASGTSSTGSLTRVNNGAGIGGRFTTGSHTIPFNGKIDQVRIFNRALDETTNGEVTTL